MNALGRHIIVELYGCSASKLSNVEYVEQSMVLAAEKSGATIVNSTFHHFQPLGVSGVVVIQESHLAIHTWPEYGFASLDVFTCGETINPWLAYELLKDAMQADYGSATEMWRGAFSLLHKTEFVPSDSGETAHASSVPASQHVPIFSRNTWFTEFNEDIAFSVKHAGHLLYSRQSHYQDIKVYETSKFGNTLLLDDRVMCTEKDEFVYHEMIAHVPMLTHPDPQRALVIGGGDGGTVRELLKHDGLEEVVLVEIDEFVIEAAQKHLPTIAIALDHPKLKLHVADGIDYVHSAPDQSFDLIIVDSTDPVGPAEGLFNQAFYQQVYRCLKNNGILVAQSESPLFNVPVFQSISRCHKQIFGDSQVHCYLASIPTYPLGLWSFSYAAKGSIHPLKGFNQERAIQFAQQQHLKYYNADIHGASFSLPTFVQQLLADQP